MARAVAESFPRMCGRGDECVQAGVLLGPEGFYRRTGLGHEATCKLCRVKAKRGRVGSRAHRRIRDLGPPPPCSRCGDMDGESTDGTGRPDRLQGKSFGFDGPICRGCYWELRFVWMRPEFHREVERRMAIVRAEKDRLFRAGRVYDLSRSDLDRILPRGG